MSLLKKIYPEQPLKELRWFDIGIVTLIMFGQFIVRSTQMYLASLSPNLPRQSVRHQQIQPVKEQLTLAISPCRLSS